MRRESAPSTRVELIAPQGAGSFQWRVILRVGVRIAVVSILTYPSREKVRSVDMSVRAHATQKDGAKIAVAPILLADSEVRYWLVITI